MIRETKVWKSSSSSSSGGEPFNEHSHHHKLTPFWTVLCPLPRQVEAQVVRLEVEFDGTEPGPPWSTSCAASLPGDGWELLWGHADEWWPCDGSARAMWAKRRRRLDVMREVTGSWLVLRLTSTLVIWAVYGIRKIGLRRRHHWSKASIRRLDSFVILQVSAPYSRIGSMYVCMYVLYSRTLVCRLMEECHRLCYDRVPSYMSVSTRSFGEYQTITHSSCVNTWANVDKRVDYINLWKSRFENRKLQCCHILATNRSAVGM